MGSRCGRAIIQRIYSVRWYGYCGMSSTGTEQGVHANIGSHTSSITMRDSSQAFISILHGPCAQHLGHCLSPQPSVLQRQHFTFPSRVTTSLFQTWTSSPMTSEFAISRDYTLLTKGRLLSRVAAWDNGYKGIGFQYTNEPPERDPDMMSIASFQSRQSFSNSVRSPSMSRR